MGTLTRALWVLWLATAGACAQSDASARVSLPEPPREFRGAWIATVDNIDWPSRPGLSADRQREELRALLDRAVRLRLNALVFQVRPACDALYPSRLEPWAEWLTGRQGENPGWDPLQFAIDGARARGLELHAWFNPFRARHRAAQSRHASHHPALRPGWAVRYGEEEWLDPGLAEVRRHAADVIFDVVERYDIDGVHIDDYFYPYPVGGKPFPDEASYARYRAGGGSLSRGDWRRHNVNRLVQDLYRGIKDRKPWVKFGISPFGIARPGVPAGIEAGLDQYADLYADVRKWLDEGWCDYIAPQLYWPVRQRPQSYPVLLSWWARANTRGRHLWIGNYTSQTVRKDDPWSAEEILEQIRITRDHPGATGNIHFSVKALSDRDAELPRRLEVGPYVEPALIPASPWLDGEAPDRPELRTSTTRDGSIELRWSLDEDVRWRAVYLRCSGRWRMVQVLPGEKPGLRLSPEDIRALRVSAFAVTAVDRCGNESDPAHGTLP